MTVEIFRPRRGGVPPFNTTFALQQDNWNDYGFQTLYHLYHRQTASNSSSTMIGSVKILRRGQTESDGIQISRPFESLDENFCSVGASLDYYQRLNEIPLNERDEILSTLRDVVAQPELQAEFRDEPGWSTSLFRDDPHPDDFLADARAILTGNFSALSDIGESISFRPTNWSTDLMLEFDAPELPPFFGGHRLLGFTEDMRSLPRRIIAVIGRNGSGKSTLLSRIARVAFSSPSDRIRPEIQALGAFEPGSIGFIKIIAISYSAFDNFIVPGLYESELRQIADDIEKGGGRYIYAGLRDIVAEVRDDLAAAEDRQLPDDEPAQLAADDLRTATRLKSLAQLADEFERLINQINNNDDNELLNAALKPLFSDPSFADVENREPSELLGPDPREEFLGWSTGHKIVLHVIASLVAHTTRKSLILFDEPEMHLHPPLIAALMHAFRIVLEEKDALAIVATHSPIVLQETLAQHVRIVRRNGQNFEVLAPGIETFGENIGVLTYDTFGLTAASTDFHKILDQLIVSFSDIDEINELFTPRLSGQALAYVMEGLARKARQ